MIRRFAITRAATLSVLALALVALGTVASPALGDCPNYDWLPWESVEQLNGIVYAATTWDPDGPCGNPPLLILGGAFTHAGALQVNRIVAWDGMNWLPLGNGVTGGDGPAVYALATYNGDLIAGGYFRDAGGLQVMSIARWDGVSWHGCGGGVTGSPYWVPGGVCALATYAGNLIVGGGFDAVAGGNLSVRNIASWDGASWHDTLGELYQHDNIAGGCSDLIVYDGKLIAAGNFDRAGGVVAVGLAAWDGSVWTPLGDPGWGISDLTSYGTQLVVGGGFTSIGGVSAKYIASWDGTSWQPLGSGMGGRSPHVYAVHSYNGSLVAGGKFTSADGAYVLNIAEWNGSSWQAMGSGASAEVYAMTLFGGDLIVGGNFTTAGDIGGPRVARWGCTMMKGDMDCSGNVDLDDIGPFVLALVDPPAYGLQQPDCDVMLADCNRDGYVNGCDIQPFVNLLLDQ